MGGCWLRAVANGHDTSECYTREGKGDDEVLEHYEWMVLFGMVFWG